MNKTGRRDLAGFVWSGLFVALVGVDELTKALAPHAQVMFDPGAGTWLPPIVGSEFKGADTGPVVNALSCIVLAACGAFVARRVRYWIARAGATVLLAGLTANLLDRIGMAGLTQGVRGRVVVNWFDIGVDGVGVGTGGVHFGNVADMCYAAGTAMLLVAAARGAGRSVRRRERLSKSAETIV
jgi:lipoprotein signal peptidase